VPRTDHTRAQLVICQAGGSSRGAVGVLGEQERVLGRNERVGVP
jgi:hypothetical protein